MIVLCARLSHERRARDDSIFLLLKSSFAPLLPVSLSLSLPAAQAVNDGVVVCCCCCCCCCQSPSLSPASGCLAVRLTHVLSSDFRSLYTLS